MAILDRVDAIIFTAGVGENSSFIREKALNEMSHLGVQVDLEKNEEKSREERSIHSPDSQTDILVIPTNEELLIARETKKQFKKVIKEKSNGRFFQKSYLCRFGGK